MNRLLRLYLASLLEGSHQLFLWKSCYLVIKINEKNKNFVCYFFIRVKNWKTNTVWDLSILNLLPKQINIVAFPCENIKQKWKGFFFNNNKKKIAVSTLAKVNKNERYSPAFLWISEVNTQMVTNGIFFRFVNSRSYTPHSFMSYVPSECERSLFSTTSYRFKGLNNICSLIIAYYSATVCFILKGNHIYIYNQMDEYR